MKTTKQRATLVIVMLVSLVLCCFGGNLVETVSNDCPECETIIEEKEVIKEVEVMKEIEVEDESCKKAKHNEKVYAEILKVDNEAFLLIAGIFDNLEYYMVYPDEFDSKIEEMDSLVTRKNTLLDKLE